MKKYAAAALLAAALCGGAETVTYTPDDTWKAIEWKPLTLVSGSALDFSRFAPAVEPLTLKGEGFYTPKGEQRRLNGVGVTHGLTLLEKEESEKLAKLIAASGFNAVRFHLYPDFIGQKDPDDRDWTSGRSSAKLDPDKLDKFHYLLACLKKEGIYFTMPIASWGYLKPGVVKDIPEYREEKIRIEVSALYPISEDAMKYVCDFARNLFGSVNPYTGIRVIDDPALISLESANENSPYAVIEHRPKMAEVYRRLCGEAMKGASKAEVEKALPRFILDKHEAGFLRFKAFLTKELGCKKPMTDMGFRDNMIYAEWRANPALDYVDIHGYFDLYKRPAGMKPPQYTIRGINPLKERWATTARTAVGRIPGKPFFAGEYNSNYPNPFWAHMPPSEAAWALSQNWTAIFLYGLPATSAMVFKTDMTPANYIQSFNPMILYAARIGGMMMQRNEIKPFALTIPIVLTPEYLDGQLTLKGGQAYPAAYRDLAMRCRVGSIIWRPGVDLGAYPAVVIPADMTPPAGMKAKRIVKADDHLLANLADLLPGQSADRAIGVNGQMETDSAVKITRLATPKSECLMIPVEAGRYTGKSFTVDSPKGGSATCFMGSLDDRDLIESGRLIAFYLTDLRNSGCVLEFNDDGLTYLRELGTSPFLLRQGEAEFTLRSKRPGVPKVWALKQDGRRGGEIKAAKTAEGFSFKAAAVTAPDTFFAFEICWE